MNLDWLGQLAWNAVGVTVVLGFVGIICRKVIFRLILKPIDLHFERKVERFRADLSAKEAELAQIRSSVNELRTGRMSLRYSKKVEYAELLCRECHTWAKLGMLINVLMNLNYDKVMHSETDRSELSEYFQTLSEMLKVESVMSELKAADLSVAQLYLDEDSLKFFGVYKAIMVQAVSIIKMGSISGGLKLIKTDHLTKKIIELAPTSVDGFEQHGDGYAFYWAEYFRENTIRSLKQLINGDLQNRKELVEFSELNVGLVSIREDVRKKMIDSGLPADLMVPEGAGPNNVL